MGMWRNSPFIPRRADTGLVRCLGPWRGVGKGVRGEGGVGVEGVMRVVS